MSCLHNEILLEKYYKEFLEEIVKEFKDNNLVELLLPVLKQKAEKLARQKLEDWSY